MATYHYAKALIILVILCAQLCSFAAAQKSKNGSSSAKLKPKPKPKQKSPWLTLNGNAPLVVARGGFSGLFPDSSGFAYGFAMSISVPDVVLWCDVQLTKDGVGICFPNVRMDNAFSDIDNVYENRGNSYIVNGVKTQGYFSIDFTNKELKNVSLTQGNLARSFSFDNSGLAIQTVQEVFSQNEPSGYWLNVQHDAFYSQHKLSMRSFVVSVSKKVIISHISSPEVGFLQGLAKPFASTKTKLVFRFLDQDITEPSTKKTYGSLLKNLTFIKTFASALLVPKAYIWPLDSTSYLKPHTSLVADAHKIGLQVFAADFVNDDTFAYNYSYNPVSEYLNFIDNGEFSVDGVLSDFPITASEARECFAHVKNNASGQAKPLIISHGGASGNYPPCTDIAYTKAISDGADVIDCPVQMSKDGVPFCFTSINLMNSTTVAQTEFRSQVQTINELQSSPGIFPFSLTWADIQGLTPMIANPYSDQDLHRNPEFQNAGKFISLSDFLVTAKNATSLTGVLIKIENAEYLAANQGLSVTDAVLEALDKAGYNATAVKKVMIQSSHSSVLKKMKGKNYELVYEVDEKIRGLLKDTIADIKTFAHSVVVEKHSVFPILNPVAGFVTGMTDTVSVLQSSNISVYVQLITNEFVSQAFDFLSDPYVEINSYVMGANVDGVITDYPHTASSYRKNLCLKMKTTPPYMSAAQPGGLVQLIDPSGLPPAMAPAPLLTDSDVSEPPLSPAVQNASAPPPSDVKPSPKPSSQQQIAASLLFSLLATIAAAAQLF